MKPEPYQIEERLNGFKMLATATKAEQKAYYDASWPESQALIRDWVTENQDGAKRREWDRQRREAFQVADAAWRHAKIAYAQALATLATTSAARETAKEEMQCKWTAS